jgi:hypothetical protein
MSHLDAALYIQVGAHGVLPGSGLDEPEILGLLCWLVGIIHLLAQQARP